MKLPADLTFAELREIVRGIVREERAAERKLRSVKAPTRKASPKRVAQVRRSLRQLGVG